MITLIYNWYKHREESLTLKHPNTHLQSPFQDWKMEDSESLKNSRDLQSQFFECMKAKDFETKIHKTDQSWSTFSPEGSASQLPHSYLT